MSSTSSPTASEIRAPVEYSSSSSARLRSVNGPSDGLSPPAPASSASTWSRLRLLGSRRPGVGGLTACATSNSARPSAAANRCRPRTAIRVRAADTADSGDDPGSRIAAPQRHQEFADIVLAGLGQVVDAAQREVLEVAAQVAAIGAQGIGRDAPLDRQMIEITLQLGLQRRRQRGHSSGLPGARTPSACRPTVHPPAAVVRDPSLTAYAAKIPATARELTISPLKTRPTASAIGIPLQGHVGFFVMRLGPVDLRQAGGQIDPHRFVAESGCGIQIDQHLPGLRLQAGLLAEFPGGGQMRGFAVDVEQSGGQLPQPSTEGVAILVDHRDAAVVVHRDDGHRAVVLDDLARHDLPAGHPDMVARAARKSFRCAGFRTISSRRRVHPRATGSGSASDVSAPSRCSLPFAGCSGISIGSRSAAL